MPLPHDFGTCAPRYVAALWAGKLALKHVRCSPALLGAVVLHPFLGGSPLPKPPESYALSPPFAPHPQESWPVVTGGWRTLTHLWLGPTMVRSRTGWKRLREEPLPSLGDDGKMPSHPGWNLLGLGGQLPKPERPLLLSGQKEEREAGTWNQQERACLERGQTDHTFGTTGCWRQKPGKPTAPHALSPLRPPPPRPCSTVW